MINLCVIPARGGSRRIPRKNIRSFHGKPIIAYSIEAAKASNLFRYIVVSTDDDEIAAIAKQYGAWVFMRPERLAQDEVGTREVTIEVLNQVMHETSSHIDYVCCLYATAPLLNVHDLIAGYLQCTGRMVHAISVGYPPLQDAAQFYWSHAVALPSVEYFGEDTSLVHIPSHRVCDINVENDWLKVEQMYAELHKEEA